MNLHDVVQLDKKKVTTTSDFHSMNEMGVKLKDTVDFLKSMGMRTSDAMMATKAELVKKIQR